MPDAHGLRPRDRWLIAGVLGLVAVLVVAVVVSLFSGAQGRRRGCIDVSVPAAMGAGELSRCGAQARALCGSALSAGDFGGRIGPALVRECRRAGLPVGR